MSKGLVINTFVAGAFILAICAAIAALASFRHGKSFGRFVPLGTPLSQHRFVVDREGLRLLKESEIKADENIVALATLFVSPGPFPPGTEQDYPENVRVMCRIQYQDGAGKEVTINSPINIEATAIDIVDRWLPTPYAAKRYISTNSKAGEVFVSLPDNQIRAKWISTSSNLVVLACASALAGAVGTGLILVRRMGRAAESSVYGLKTPSDPAPLTPSSSRSTSDTYP